MNDLVSDHLLRRLADGGLGPTVLPDGSAVMVDFDGHRVLSLSKTGAVLVQQMQSGVGSVSSLAQALVERFDVDFEQAKRDTEAFIDELASGLSSRP